MRRFFALAVVFLGFVSNAGAESKTSLSEGAISLSFAVPSGGSVFSGPIAGAWYMLGDNTNLGLNIGFRLDNFEAGSSWEMALIPTVKRYIRVTESVAPFIYGAASLRIFNNPNTEDDPEFSLTGGGGLEWFFVPQASIAGHIGLKLDILPAGLADPIGLRSFTSGLSAQIYWK